ncbi:hypothetical protein AB3480_34460 [Rhizobium mongolense]|uniref:hypothetical protein n=1 Tax=Rhizobium mongolense TaxID=57676 RepID=UPI0034A0DD53
MPAVPYLTNYQQAWSQMGRTFLNSVPITVPAVAFSVLLGAIAGFPLLQLKGRVGFVIYLFLPTGMLVPYQIVPAVRDRTRPRTISRKPEKA